MLLMALESLYKDSQELDVRLGLLRVLLQILQRHGAAPILLRVSFRPAQYPSIACGASTRLVLGQEVFRQSD